MDIPLASHLELTSIIFIIALTMRGLFAFIETTITSLRLFRLRELSNTFKQYEFILNALEKNPHRVLVTTLVVSSLAEVCAASLGTFIVERLLHYLQFSAGIAFSCGIAFTSICIIIFGEIIPKNLARMHGERVFSSFLWLLYVVYRLLSPFVSILMRISDIISYAIGSTPSHEAGLDLACEREIRFLIDHVRDRGHLEPEKTEMIQNVFELGKTPVKEIMVPATDIISLDIETPLKDALHVFSEKHFTRLPVYKGKSDNIVGIAHQKDIFVLLSRGQNKPLQDLIRPIMFIPESVKINQLLREFRQRHIHLAIVLNEHGSVTGLITLEDVLEEIVGDINDEHELNTEKIVPLPRGGWVVDASITLEELSDFFTIDFETEDAVTLGGFLAEQLQHLPKKGERISYKNLQFQIQKASKKRVRQVLITTKNVTDTAKEE
jgi:putative hemolysin